jgi:hypothetical protein
MIGAACGLGLLDASSAALFFGVARGVRPQLIDFDQKPGERQLQ